ncbi:MAG TPA: 2-amino-4-hydroxy-6-hydroxymethyldihydropteridine diphosphokinase, partial [Hyphomicrobiales bacterium]|nr:2-amino-4-hydroxy-6-hydroxymethyldihydropteridine diphosphokinase [Hyphomicrobiales bacterium]
PRAELRRWPPRQLDLDIICYKATICNWTGGRPLQGKPLVLPHPRAHERAFVLTPILDIAPNWHHPVFGLTAAQLLKRPIARGIGAITGVEGSLR